MKAPTEAVGGARDRRRLRFLVSLIPPLVSVGLQLALSALFHPSVWVLCYPATFLSSWIGGLRSAIVACALCALSAFWFFLPSGKPFEATPAHYIGLVVFAGTSVLFGIFHDRLRVATRRVATANQDLASLVELAPEGIFTADRDGRYTDVNGAGCRMLGLRREELIGRTIRDLIPADRLGQLEREREQLLQGREVVSEWVLRKQDGTWLPVEVSAKILPDGRWQGLVRNIAERKRLEAALQASHADFVRAQSVAEVGSWRLDVQHNVLHWSDEEYRIFGVAPGTPMTYEAFLACVHPDDRALVDREWQAGLAGKPYDIEHRILVDGEVRWVREKADLEFDVDRRLVGGIGVTLDVTTRRRREEELRKTRERLDLALRGADLATWDWDVASGEVVFNARWAEMRGYRPDELRGHVDTWLAGVHPDDRPWVTQVLEEYLEGRRSEYETEHRVRTRDGAWIWVLDRGKIFERDERGAPIRMAGTELDITSRRSAEDALRLSEAKAAGIVSISADAIISVDEQQRITLFNRGAETIFGYTKDEILGAPLEQLIPARFRAAHRQHAGRFAAEDTGARRMGETRTAVFGLRKDGSEFPADAAISRLAVDGTTILTVALRDVTEQKRVEDGQRILSETGSLLAASLELEATLTSVGQIATRSFADVCIVYLVERGQIRRVTATCRDLPGVGCCEDLTRMPVDRARAPEVWAELDANRAVRMEHVSDDMLVAFAGGDEHLRALRELSPRSIIMAPLFVHEQLLGAIGFISRAAKRTYAPADVALARQIAERAAYAIDSARLYATAQRAVEGRDTVLAVVAHDLRNPLGSILLQAALLRRPAAEPELRSRRIAEAIERSARRMNRIIQDLLDVTRIEQGQLEIEPRRLSVEQAIAESMEAQVPLAEAASLAIALDLEPNLPAVWADQGRLLQILENLVGNAVKFTEAGGTIRVGAERRQGEVIFSVADTGKGIPSEHLPHLFDRYWQARRSDRRGLGLGLVIVKGLVEAHGGRVWVTSAVGQGTTFFFSIPVAGPAEPGRANPPREPSNAPPG